MGSQISKDAHKKAMEIFSKLRSHVDMTKQDVRTTLWQSWPAKVTLEVDDFTPVLGIRRDSS